jgi:hypothetical protein
MENFTKWFKIHEDAEQFASELFQALKNNTTPDLYVHFTQTPKIGINPKPTHGDPAGIYAFPKKYVLSSKINSNTMFVSYPYAYIIKLKPETRTLNLQNVSQQQADQFVEKHKSMIAADRLDHLNSSGQWAPKSPGEKFWQALQYLKQSNYKANGLNGLLRKMNIDAVYDEQGIIHNNEKEQLLVLTPNVIEVVQFVQLGNMSNRIKKIAWQFISLCANNFFGKDYKVSSSRRYSNRVIYAHGVYNGKDMSMWLDYYIENDKSDRKFYGSVHLASRQLVSNSNNLKYPVEVNIEDALSKNYLNMNEKAKRISDDFKEEIEKLEFREPKDATVKEVANEINKIFGLTKSPTPNREREGESIGITRNYKLGRLTINIYYSDYSKKYQVSIIIKTTGAFGVQINGTAESEEPNAKELVSNAMKHLESQIYTHYHPDPDKHGTYNYDYSWRGKGLIKFLDYIKAKIKL